MKEGGLVLAKSRKIVGINRKESWVKAEIRYELDETGTTIEQLKDAVGDLDFNLDILEATEREYWRNNK